MTPQKTDPDTPMSTQEFPVEVWVGSGLLQGRGTECSRECTNLLEEVAIIFINSLASGQATGRAHSPSHQQKIGLKIY